MKRPLERGDRLEITWVDVVESPVGDTGEASLIERTTIGYFWEYKASFKVNCMVLTTTLDTDGSHQQGWLCLPQSLITSARRLPRPRKGKS